MVCSRCIRKCTLTPFFSDPLFFVEDLVGPEPNPAAKRGPAPKLQQQMDRIAKLPKTRQRFVMDMLDSMLGQAGR
jgi:hypothetical protein